MSRLVVPRRLGAGDVRSAEAARNAPHDAYKERIVKYIPAEAVAFYTFADKLVASNYHVVAGNKAPAEATAALPVAWILLVLGVIGTPIYLWRQKEDGQPWVLNAVISTIAFVLWAYTLGGTAFVLNGWYSVFLAGLLAPIFTFVAGFLEPKPV